MLQNRHLASSSFRLTLAFVVLFCVAALVLLAFIYVASARFMEEQTKATIDAEIEGLVENYQAGGPRLLLATIDRRAKAQPHRESIYLLLSPSGKRLAGNLDVWPVVTPESDGSISAV